MEQVSEAYYGRDFWVSENLKYERPHFRMEKVARLANAIAGDRACDLLDIGCGPAALKSLLRDNICYFGIDIAIQRPAAHLLQSDFVENPIAFGSRRFDIVVAQGVFEYMGEFQSRKFDEICAILKPNGVLVVSYVNFDHRNRQIYWPYNNVQPMDKFRADLSRYFDVQRCFATSHRWHHDEPRRRLDRALQSRINLKLPWLSRNFAVEYLFVARPLSRRDLGLPA